MKCFIFLAESEEVEELLTHLLWKTSTLFIHIPKEWFSYMHRGHRTHFSTHDIDIGKRKKCMICVNSEERKGMEVGMGYSSCITAGKYHLIFTECIEVKS